MKRVRVIKVIVQPVLVVDDGESLVELSHEPISVSASDWPDYSSDRFPRELAEFEARLNEADTTPAAE